MREYKFRAWVPEVSKMIPWNYINLEMEYGYGGVKDNSINDVLKDVENQVTSYFELMQYTGLKDKNGKEIFDGDIVDLDGFDSHGDFGEYKLEFKGIFKVEWREDLAGFDLCKVDANVDGWCLTEDSRHDLTVIGNIYENADLLKA